MQQKILVDHSRRILAVALAATRASSPTITLTDTALRGELLLQSHKGFPVRMSSLCLVEMLPLRCVALARMVL